MTYQPNNPIPCTICGNASKARKLCKPCYHKERRKGSLDKHSLLSPNDVFEDRILKTDTCWLWQGSTNSYGYGIFLLPGEKKVRAHRFSYEKWVGKLLADQVVLHMCDNPICVNPQHLKAGTKLDNNQDAKSKNRHAFGERNGHAKLTAEQILAIKADNRKHFIIANEYGIGQPHVSRIKSGKRRTLG